MKIVNTASALDSTLKEITWWTHAIVAVPLLYLAAGLVPGDAVNLNVAGSLALIVMLIIADTFITVSCYLWRRKIRKPVRSLR